MAAEDESKSDEEERSGNWWRANYEVEVRVWDNATERIHSGKLGVERPEFIKYAIDYIKEDLLRLGGYE